MLDWSFNDEEKKFYDAISCPYGTPFQLMRVFKKVRLVNLELGPTRLSEGEMSVPGVL